MSQHPIKPVENYTNPFLVMAFVNLFSALILLWGVYGYGAALLGGFIAYIGIRLLQDSTP